MMSKFPIITKESASKEQAAVLEKVERAYGFVPNLMGTLVNSAAVADAYLHLSKFFDNTNLNTLERQVVMLEASRRNHCEYCVAAHSVIAGMHRVPEDVIESIRDGSPIDDKQLEALRRFTQEVIEQRGFVTPYTMNRFKQAGYEDKHMLDVILGVAWKTISNYTNHIAATPVDAVFQKAAWSA